MQRTFTTNISTRSLVGESGGKGFWESLGLRYMAWCGAIMFLVCVLVEELSTQQRKLFHIPSLKTGIFALRLLHYGFVHALFFAPPVHIIHDDHILPPRPPTIAKNLSTAIPKPPLQLGHPPYLPSFNVLPRTIVHSKTEFTTPRNNLRRDKPRPFHRRPRLRLRRKFARRPQPSNPTRRHSNHDHRG